MTLTVSGAVRAIARASIRAPIMGYYKMTKNRYEAEIDAIILREEKRMATKKAERQAKQDAWNLAKKGKVCPADDGHRICISPDCPGRICAQFARIGLDACGQPLRKSSRPICGAKTRKGTSRQMGIELGEMRCRLHGGLSTGPNSAEGRERIGEAQRLRWTAWHQAKLQD